MKKSTKKCEGCVIFKKSFKNGKSSCRIIETGKNNLCPCRECIVKTTCDIMCDKFKNFTKESWGDCTQEI